MQTKSIKKRAAAAVLLLVMMLIPSMVSAEPVWSGNASVDGTEFVNFIEDTPLAGASSSFTRNTVIEVTNTQNGRTVEVTVVKRAPRPGVFLVLSTAAGEALGLPSDQVVPVQVRVKSDLASSAYENRFESPDPDINPAVTLPEESVEAGTALVPPDGAAPEELLDDASGTPAVSPGALADVDEAAEEPDFLDGPVPVPLPTEPAALAGEAVVPGVMEEPEVPEVPAVDEIPEDSFPMEEDSMVPEAAEDRAESPGTEVPEETGSLSTEEEFPPLEAAAAENPVAEAPVTDDSMEDLLPEDADEDNVIYFLTPSDFRPPKAPEVEEEIVPVYVDREELEDRIEKQLENGSSYIQLGAYSSSELVYAEMDRIAVRYPMVVWTDKSAEGDVYKLLVGPLTADETGVLVYRFRAAGYQDLFLYRP